MPRALLSFIFFYALCAAVLISLSSTTNNAVATIDRTLPQLQAAIRPVLGHASKTSTFHHQGPDAFDNALAGAKRVEVDVGHARTDMVKRLTFPAKVKQAAAAALFGPVGLGLLATATLAFLYRLTLRVHQNTTSPASDMMQPLMVLTYALDPEDNVEPTEEQKKMLDAWQQRPQEDSDRLNSAMSFLGFGQMPLPQHPALEDEHPSNPPLPIQPTTMRVISGSQEETSEEPEFFSQEYFQKMEEAQVTFKKELAAKKAATAGTEGQVLKVTQTQSTDASWLDDDEDEGEDDGIIPAGQMVQDLDELQARCAAMEIEELATKLGMLRKAIAQWKDEFFVVNSREPTEEDVEASDAANLFMQHQIVAQWLTLKRSRKQQQRLGLRYDESDDEMDTKRGMLASRPETRFSAIQGQDEVALRKLCVQTEQACAEMTVDLLKQFKVHLEEEIVAYKKSTLTEDYGGAGNVHDLPMLRMYLQYGIVRNWLQIKTNGAEESAQYQAHSEKIDSISEELERRCKLMTTSEMTIRKAVLKEEILEWKRNFVAIHGRSPGEDDVFELGMESAFTEYGIVSSLLEGRKEDSLSQMSG